MALDCTSTSGRARSSHLSGPARKPLRWWVIRLEPGHSGWVVHAGPMLECDAKVLEGVQHQSGHPEALAICEPTYRAMRAPSRPN